MDVKIKPKKMPAFSFKQYQYILVPLAVLVIIVVATAFYIVPTYGQIKTNNAAIAVEQAELKKLQDKYTVLNNSDETKLEQELAETRAALPENKNVPGLVAGLTRLAAENNVSIDALQLKPGKIATDSASGEVVVRLSLKGDLRNVNAFLNKLGEIRRIFGVQKLTGTGSSGEFVTSLDVSFYTLPLPNNLGSNYADPLPELSKTKQNLITQIAQYPIYTESIGNAPSTISSASATPVASPLVSPSTSPVATASAR